MVCVDAMILTENGGKREEIPEPKQNPSKRKLSHEKIENKTEERRQAVTSSGTRQIVR